MEYVLLFVALAMVVEFLTEIVKGIVNSLKTKDVELTIIQLVAIIFGEIVAFVSYKELLPILQIQQKDNVFGLIALMGLIISAGSTKVFDLFKRIREKSVK